MNQIQHIYIDGRFVEPHGREMFDLYNPASGEVIGAVRLGDEHDARVAIASAKRALPAISATTKAERIDMLHALHAAVSKGIDAISEAMIEEFGATKTRAKQTATGAAEAFAQAASTLKAFQLERQVGTAQVAMTPVGVVGLITPWNANPYFICHKLAYALAAGCTAVIKPSEMSAIQTEVLLQHMHEAGLPVGTYNVVNGRGDVVGAEFTSHPDVSKISFTGSTAVGKAIVRASADTLKRVTLELGGKSPTLILDDADLPACIPTILGAGFFNSGQACVAGTRILVSERRRAELEGLLKEAVSRMKVGDPRDPETVIGPMVSQTQYDRVQGYIRLGLEEGAEVLVGGQGHPDGLAEGLNGYFVRPTVFTGVGNQMRVAREEIFGPVLCILTYKDEDDAIAIANDTPYGLAANILSSDGEHALRLANRIESGQVVINGAPHELLAPFGGFKQSGLGRENGAFGLEAFLEPKTILSARAA